MDWTKIPLCISWVSQVSTSDIPPGKPQLGYKDVSDLDPSDRDVWQAKLDGAFMYYKLGPDGARAFSYRRSQKTGKPIEHTAKLQGLSGAKVPKWLHGAVIQGEAWHPDLESREVGGILNTRKPGVGSNSLRPALHGIHRIPGIDVDTLSPSQKVDLTKRIAKDMKIFDLPDMAISMEDKEDLLERIRSRSHKQTYEGIVGYPQEGKPYKAVFAPTYDEPVVGHMGSESPTFRGRGAGAILVGNLDEPTRVGTGLSHAMRQAIHRNPELLKGMVARVKAQERFPSGKLRAPRLEDFHPEKSDPEAYRRFYEAVRDPSLGTMSKLAKPGSIPSLDRDTAIKRINSMGNVSSQLNMEFRAGQFRKPGDSLPMPLAYGEIKGIANPADGDPWDVMLAPGARVKDDLKVVGYLPSRDREGNDKLLLANRGVISNRAKSMVRNRIRSMNQKGLDTGVYTPEIGGWLHDPVYLEKQAMIVESDGKFKVTTKDGSRILGTHDLREAALRQLRAIEASKAGRVKAAVAKDEFAPGIPSNRKIHPISQGRGQWELSIQRHDADVAGSHYDLRLGDPATGHGHSWAIPKASLPDEKKRIRLAVQQPTHTLDYFDYEGAIPSGTYGSGNVKLVHRARVPVTSDPERVSFNVPDHGEFVLRKKKDNNWMLIKKREQAVEKLATRLVLASFLEKVATRYDDHLFKGGAADESHQETGLAPLIGALAGTGIGGAIAYPMASQSFRQMEYGAIASNALRTLRKLRSGVEATGIPPKYFSASSIPLLEDGLLNLKRYRTSGAIGLAASALIAASLASAGYQVGEIYDANKKLKSIASPEEDPHPDGYYADPRYFGKKAEFESHNTPKLNARLTPFRKDLSSKLKPKFTIEAPAKNVVSTGVADSGPIGSSTGGNSSGGGAP
jgi:hypothetical protein